MKTAILALSEGGRALAAGLASRLPAAMALDNSGSVAQVLTENWQDYDGFICIMATGIVVRSIAPLLRDKLTDPCVVVVDEKGRFAISLLSGHLGGGNDLARQVAAVTGGDAVITTASDNLGLTALDLWARDNGLRVGDNSTLTRVSAKLVNLGQVKVFTEVFGPLPADFNEIDTPDSANLVISYRTGYAEDVLQLYPPQLVVGIGCNRGTAEQEIAESLHELFDRHRLAVPSVARLASINLKSDEDGLLAFAARNDWPLEFFTKKQLNEVSGVSYSDAVMKATGAQGVAEPAALLAARNGQLIIRKEKWKNVTMAVAVADYMLSAPDLVI